MFIVLLGSSCLFENKMSFVLCILRESLFTQNQLHNFVCSMLTCLCNMSVSLCALIMVVSSANSIKPKKSEEKKQI